MKIGDLLKWFDEIASIKIEVALGYEGLSAAGMKWVCEAGSAIAAAFPRDTRCAKTGQRHWRRNQ